MRFVSKLALAAMFAAALSLMNPAMAGCRRMGFTVNDYGLEGPKRDAQNLLDKHISEWALEQGIEKYNIGKKDVSCELYLNLVVFDEHTCTATATVCWGESINRNKPQTASTKKPAPVKKEASKKAKSSEAEEAEKDETKAADAKAASEDETDESTTQSASDESKSDDETEAAATETDEPSEVETGAIPVPSTAAGTAAAVSNLNVEAVAEGTADADSSQANEATAAAAEAAAAAAERAANAAERAAKAAERAAAALAKIPTESTSPPETSATGSPVAPVAPTNP